jgi:hypothetical protein
MLSNFLVHRQKWAVPFPAQCPPLVLQNQCHIFGNLGSVSVFFVILVVCALKKGIKIYTKRGVKSKKKKAWRVQLKQLVFSIVLQYGISR